MVLRHILLVTFPAQGHINPSLQFADRLVRIGVKVTFIISTFIKRHVNQLPVSDGLSLVEFSDGYDDGFKGSHEDVGCYMSSLKSNASETIRRIVDDSRNKHGDCEVIDCIVYTLLLPWVAEVARALQLQSTLLWIQPATVFHLYYYYFNGYGDMIRDKTKQSPSCPIELPSLPFSFTSRDLPSFFVPTNIYSFALPLFEEQFKIFAEAAEADETTTVLVNTFDSLELQALSPIDGINLVGIGPMIQSDNSLAANFYKPSEDNYMDWLNSKPESSVVYVSFGSISVLSRVQMEELERGLTESGNDFLWVVRPPREGELNETTQEDIYKMLTSKHIDGTNMIVPWCNQIKVLSHPSVGCFLTHCGWNSTLESLVHGVPMVAFPQWTDQGTNAMLVEDVWKTGVRVTASGEDGLVIGDEIKKCLETVMGDREIKKNASKWKELANEAVKETGSSYRNLKAFIEQGAN